MIASATEFHRTGPGDHVSEQGHARRSSKLRRPGWVFIVTSLFLAIGAFNGQNNLLFFAFGLSVCAILLSGLIGGSSLLGLRVQRIPPRAVGVGDTGSVRYAVTNRNRFLPVFGVLIEEMLETGDSQERGGVERTPGLLLSVRAGETVRVQSRLTGTRTGVVRLRGFRVRSSLPFGLLEKRIDFACRVEVEVRPAVLPVRAVRERNSGNRRTPVSASSRRVGGDEEFLGVREFVEGDSARKIAWARSAAHDSLVVRTNAQPQPQTCWIVLDPRADTVREREFALTAAASLAADRIQRGIAVGVEVPEWGAALPVRGGREQLNRILSMLARRRGPEPFGGRPRTGEVVHVSAGLGGDIGPVVRINATDPSSWLAARATLPAALAADVGGSRRWGFGLRLRETAVTASARTPLAGGTR